MTYSRSERSHVTGEYESTAYIRLEPHLTETGVWCETCLLPSAIRFVITVEGGRPDTDVMGGMVTCPDCADQSDSKTP